MADWQSLLETPSSLKPIQKFLKIANDVERLDSTIAYWTRLFAVQLGFKLDKESKEAKAFMSKIISLLEAYKQANKSDEKVTDELVARANFENFVLGIFNNADTIDRAGKANINTVKMFYMSSVLFEALSVFGSIPDEMTEKVKYARFKAAYITKCLKNGETPKPGPISPDNQLVGDQPLPQITTQLPAIDKTIPENKPDKTQPQPSACLNTSNKIAPQASNLNNSTASMKASELDALNGEKLSMENVIKAQKYLKYATASLSFNDVKNTVENLEKAMKILTTGSE